MGSSPEKDLQAHAADEINAAAQQDVPNTSVGNIDFTAELKAEGKLGLFFTRGRARPEATLVTLNVNNYYNGMFITIRDSMFHLLHMIKTKFNSAGIEEHITTVASQLAIGGCLMTYMKLRALIYTEIPGRYNSANLKRPKAVTDLQVVAPFAFAIQQLGAVNIANLTQKARYVPALPIDGHTFGIPDQFTWNPIKYTQAVNYARKFGLHFDMVDLKQKSGTAWWLLRQQIDEHIFKLKLPFPEVNFTSAMALIHTLFLNGHEADPSNIIFDLAPCGNSDYGSILRDPHHGINVSTFEVINESAKEIVSYV